MDWRRNVGILGIALSAWSGMCSAQSPDINFYRERLAWTAEKIMADLRPTLDAKSAGIIDSVVVESRSSWNTNALARKGLGQRRVVELNAGVLAYTEWLALAMVADGGGHEGCLREYSLFLADRNPDERHESGFLQYALTRDGHCKGAHLEATSEQSLEFRERVLESAVATVLLHELGHHVLGHVPVRQNSYYLSRIREVSADQWAIKAAVDAGYDLRPAAPMFLILDTMNGAPFVDELYSSHPSGVRRTRDVLLHTRTLLEKKDAASARVMDSSIKELEAALQ